LKSHGKKPFYGLSSIEGGNCFVFTRISPLSNKEQKVALVGVNSTCYSTSIAQQQKLFAHLPKQTDSSQPAPPSAAPSMFSLKLICCPSDQQAALASTRLYMRGQMLKELQVDSLIELLPKDFHIDLQMFVSPDGTTVFTDSSQLTISLLEEQVRKDPQWLPYLASAQALLSEYTAIDKENKTRLELAGFKVVEVPGSIKVVRNLLSKEVWQKFCHTTKRSLYCRASSYPLSVNFMNGVFLPNGAFLTSGIPDPSFAFFQEAFDTIYKRHMGEEAEIWHLPGDSIPRMTTYDYGGIHCVTLEM
jgi:hypothetical protein